MSSHTNLSSPRPASRSDNGISGPSQPKKPPSSSTSSAGKPPQEQQQQTLKCPRCNSPNTKFCYYNNYSLSQPRHFCKTCRRYWTRGGALRNVPVGGGCRKTKRSSAVKPSSSAAAAAACSTSSSPLFMEDSSKFFHGFVPPPMDFQLAGLSLNKIVNINPNETNNLHHLSSSSPSLFGDQNSTVDVGSGLSLMGFGDYHVTNSPAFTGAQGTVGVDGNLASSIETLSSLNQDLHWKLQQQRMAMLFASSKETTNCSEVVSNGVVERPQPILFRNLEMNSSRRDHSGDTTSTEWYFGNSAYAPSNNHNNNNNNNNINNNNQVITTSTTSDWTGVQAWTDLNQYNALP